MGEEKLFELLNVIIFERDRQCPLEICLNDETRQRAKTNNGNQEKCV
jgi:hypothetical protein